MVGKTFYDDWEGKNITIRDWKHAEETFKQLRTFKDVTTYTSEAAGYVGFSDQGNEHDMYSFQDTFLFHPLLSKKDGPLFEVSTVKIRYSVWSMAMCRRDHALTVGSEKSRNRR